MSHPNENSNYDEVEGLSRLMRQEVRKHRDNESLEQMEEQIKKDHE